jgi:UDP-N-acetylglucosamine 1-carboxyvinyltransferase
LLKKAGAKLEIGKDYITTFPSKLKSVELRTHEYPGFPTDLQAPFTVLMTQAKGISLIHETIYEGRLFYTDKLITMGAKIIMCDPHRVIVNGPTQLYGRRLESPDLRAGMALILAALTAENQTVIDNIYQIERGYEDPIGRLKKLGANIEKVKN